MNQAIRGLVEDGSSGRVGFFYKASAEGVCSVVVREHSYREVNWQNAKNEDDTQIIGDRHSWWWFVHLWLRQ